MEGIVHTQPFDVRARDGEGTILVSDERAGLRIAPIEDSAKKRGLRFGAAILQRVRESKRDVERRLVRDGRLAAHQRGAEVCLILAASLAVHRQRRRAKAQEGWNLQCSANEIVERRAERVGLDRWRPERAARE